ncbi:uncharacterized protein LOC120012517 [Tripterygium wilfordii]|uniref:uncharacterized protein LOC120012517 n=1 Tax=Tripterygium wilfordii TaxID=458696 RepID=UPI0018F849C2|nr:uncharacterized protein LOC120012517 [Tripterygium wilfordii]
MAPYGHYIGDLVDNCCAGQRLKTNLIGRRLLTTQSHQKSYTDRRSRPLEFQEEDHVFLRVSPKRGVQRFGRAGKLASRFIEPFEILERVGTRYHRDSSHIFDWSTLEIGEDATFETLPTRIADRQERRLILKTISLVKVIWQHYGAGEATWELESDLRARYLELFTT